MNEENILHDAKRFQSEGFTLITWLCCEKKSDGTEGEKDIGMKVMKENKEWRRKDWINGWSAGGNYVFMCKLVGGGMYVRLCVYVLLFTVALTIWPGFLSFLRGRSPAECETRLLLLRFIILIIRLQLLPNFPVGDWMMCKHFKQMLLLIF